jgi:hypothetical protein
MNNLSCNYSAETRAAILGSGVTVDSRIAPTSS